MSQLLGRLNGIGTPVGGVSWTPPQSDVEVAQRVLVFLEDRRVLYSPYEVEMPQHCVASVAEIRQFLTEQLMTGGIADELVGALRGMRAACREFMETISEQVAMEREFHLGNFLSGSGGWIFNQALGKLRGVFGVQIAQMAVRYGVDVPDELVPSLPAEDA